MEDAVKGGVQTGQEDRNRKMLTALTVAAALALTTMTGFAVNHGTDEQGHKRSLREAVAAFVAAEMD